MAALERRILVEQQSGMHGSYPREKRFQGSKTLEVMGRREEVDIRQCGLHAARLRTIVPPADQGIEPDDPAAAPAEPPHFIGESLRLAGIVSVGDDHHR